MKVFHPTIVAAFCTIGSAAMAQDRIYDIDGFDRVVVTDGVAAEIVVGADFAVSADALRGDIDRLEIAKRGQTLVISRNQSWGLFSEGKRDHFAVQISLPEMVAVESRSGASTDVFGPTDAFITASAYSGASLDVRDATLAAVALEASSGASLQIAGQCVDVTAQSSSGSSLIARDLDCQTADLRSSSGASLSVHATETARAHSSSGASIRIAGGAEMLERRTTSGGSVSVN